MFFLMKGIRNAFLSFLGNSAHIKNIFLVNVSTSINSSPHSLNNHVGIGSRVYDFVDNECIIFLISSSDTSVNESNTSPTKLWKYPGEYAMLLSALILLIFSNIICLAMGISNKFISKGLDAVTGW